VEPFLNEALQAGENKFGRLLRFRAGRCRWFGR